MKIPRKILIYIIKIYQITLSPILGNNCRYSPSCSAYLIGCLEKHSIIYAIYLGAKRIFNCHPFGNSGYDPVP